MTFGIEQIIMAYYVLGGLAALFGFSFMGWLFTSFELNKYKKYIEDNNLDTSFRDFHKNRKAQLRKHSL